VVCSNEPITLPPNLPHFFTIWCELFPADGFTSGNLDKQIPFFFLIAPSSGAFIIKRLHPSLHQILSYCRHLDAMPDEVNASCGHAALSGALHIPIIADLGGTLEFPLDHRSLYCWPVAAGDRPALVKVLPPCEGSHCRCATCLCPAEWILPTYQLLHCFTSC
jgi:hypothetical protein